MDRITTVGQVPCGTFFSWNESVYIRLSDTVLSTPADRTPAFCADTMEVNILPRHDEAEILEMDDLIFEPTFED